MREIYSHTALRGIASLLVVFFHYMIILEPTFDFDTHTSFFSKGYLWVDCFFILSGFILCYVYGTSPGDNQNKLIDFLWARFARIYPLHLATLIGLAGLQVLVSKIANHPLTIGTWSTFWPNLFGVHAWLMPAKYDWNFPSWSISVELAAYLLFPFVSFGFSRQPTITIGLLAASVVFALTIGRDHWEQTALIRGLPMFLFGVLVFQFRYGIERIRYVSALQTSAAGALIASLHFGLYDFAIDLLFAALIWLTWTDQGVSIALRTRPLQALGQWSYSIYMLHIPVRIVLGFALGGRLPQLLLFGIMLAGTICAGAVSYRYFEMPVRQALRRRRAVLAA
ncbi:acyltransferase family protein [Bradyrhizobium sp. GCM10023182]|uniref:Acyltransferase n=1 Tax=Bradyrhizobium zhengyangense TaxID=2911009 RepID=A0ABS9M239_9BRAD|nr:acyltransferase [Bradyrhizobium zhengyangense]MCG2673211.1 acyltransferase [Bradyrhizobium zhengyangense]